MSSINIIFMTIDAILASQYHAKKHFNCEEKKKIILKKIRVVFVLSLIYADLIFLFFLLLVVKYLVY